MSSLAHALTKIAGEVRDLEENTRKSKDVANRALQSQIESTTRLTETLERTKAEVRLAEEQRRKAQAEAKEATEKAAFAVAVEGEVLAEALRIMVKSKITWDMASYRRKVMEKASKKEEPKK